MHRQFYRLALVLLLSTVLASCGEDAPTRDPWLSELRLNSIQPALVLPGTHIQLEGTHFVDDTLGKASLRFRGAIGDEAVNLSLQGLRFVDFEHFDFILDSAATADWPLTEGMFKGVVWVEIVANDSLVYTSAELSTEFELRDSLNPTLGTGDSGAIVYVNDQIPVEGTGFFLHPSEGQSVAMISGCFRLRGNASCDPIPDTEIPLLNTASDRKTASFPFAPAIAGISSGVFEGMLSLRNVHQDGSEFSSEKIPVSYDLLPPALISVSPAGVSLGQFVDFVGGGFVAGDVDGGTELLIRGVFLPAGAQEGISVDLVLIPAFVDGRTVRYVLNEDDELGRRLGSRQVTGQFDGDLRVRVSYQGQQEMSEASPFGFDLQPIKQVVYLNFLPDYVNSLRHFGLRAVDSQIRQRVAAVVARDYVGINVEVRLEEPTDFALYSIVDILGQDINGLGLLGYDNTSGKDVDNLRLFDHIGGVNALTQQDGYPGFGGVFIESLFAFSQHPKGRAMQIGEGEASFDQIFDTFRLDVGGTPLSSTDFGSGGVAVPTTAPTCPGADRMAQAACAIWVIGNMIGTTVSHEIGHSLGLANPNSPASFHNGTDGPNRLMDSGSNRSFLERAQLQGQGPGRFCLEAYEYLREILPTSEPSDIDTRDNCF